MFSKVPTLSRTILKLYIMLTRPERDHFGIPKTKYQPDAHFTFLDFYKWTSSSKLLLNTSNKNIPDMHVFFRLSVGLQLFKKKQWIRKLV